jgi:hypothetical protein
MRHGHALLLVTAAAVTAGCSGADAQEAQLLLDQSDAAVAQVRSATFTVRLRMTGGPQEFDMTMSGGYAKGRRAGEFFVIATSETLPFRELTAVSRTGRVSMTVDGTSLGDVPVPQQDDNPIQLVDLSQYVKDVEFEHAKLIDGQPMVKISGVIETADSPRARWPTSPGQRAVASISPRRSGTLASFSTSPSRRTCPCAGSSTCRSR